MEKIKLITRYLLREIEAAAQKASAIYIITSFVMKSGVEALLPSLKEAARRGAEIKILTGDYLFVTQPEALCKLISIDPQIEVRLWQSKGNSFHPKAYLFQQEKSGVLIVGSSNLSRSALTSGIEWNLMMGERAEPDTFHEALLQFSQAFYHEQTVPVHPATIQAYEEEYDRYHKEHPQLVKVWTAEEEVELTLPVLKETYPTASTEIIKEEKETYIVPRPAQREALEALRDTVAEAYSRGMVVMATGLGKTYLAAFFARDYRRVLFIAHREEILLQAQAAFAQVMPERTRGIYNGKEKKGAVELVFASIFTLSLHRHLTAFSPDAFDLIIVDEFHHAAANSYQRVLAYFQPAFLLGITATPDRLDGKDVYALCDGNVAYQLHFIEAIQRQWLAPFRYYGIYDETDYSRITWLGTRYDPTQLLAAQVKEETAAKVFQAWETYKQTRTLAFCSSIKQASFLSDCFNRKGYKTVALHSQTIHNSRGEAIQQLERGQIDAIFTVDLFNEGVDIPSVDTLLFVRPTESLTVFTQQVGRGLRLAPGKEHCVIIDLIGNYRHADVKLRLFDTSQQKEKGQAVALPAVPEGCTLHLDLQTINLLEEMARKQQPRKEKLRFAYQRVKETLGRRPSYLELHLYGNVPTKAYRQEFHSYAGFLYWADELSKLEKEVYKKYAAWLMEVEKTVLAKSYKMIVLQYMLSRGPTQWHQPVTPQETARFFHTYLMEKEYRKRIDFSDSSSRKLWEYDEAKVSRLIAQLPMSKWSASSKGLIAFQDHRFTINLTITSEESEILYLMTKEICEYRLHKHFARRAHRVENKQGIHNK